MKKPVTVVLFAIILLQLTSCGPSVKFIGEEIDRPPKPDDYEVIYVNSTDRFSDSTKVIGEIEISDNGLSFNCGFRQVITKLEEKARLIGADAVKVTEIKYPDFHSTCYRIKADALIYTGSDTGTVTYDKILAPPDMIDSAFIAFNDCALCTNNIDSLNVSAEKTKILYIPVGIFTFYIDEARISDNYPLTEARMNEHLYMLLESYDWKLKDLSPDSSYYDSLSVFYGKILDNITYQSENPMDWNIKDSIDVEDSSTLLYIPIAIQRYAQHEMGGRFYVLVTDNKGKFLAYTCLEFDPDKWARNFNTFANDVEEKLPLVKEDNSNIVNEEDE